MYGTIQNLIIEWNNEWEEQDSRWEDNLLWKRTKQNLKKKNEPKKKRFCMVVVDAFSVYECCTSTENICPEHK